MMSSRRREFGARARGAFSLVELLVVIVIVTILTAIAIGVLQRLQTTHQKGEAMGRLRAVARAIEVYRADWGDAPPYWPGAATPEEQGPGLWALVMLDYLPSARFLSDPASDVEAPWVDDGGTRIQVTPGDPVSMAAAYNAYYSPAITGGRDLTPRETYLTYCLLARWQDHDADGATPGDFGDFTNYDDAAHENYASWMMLDPYSREWKYRPVRATVAPPAAEPAPASGGFPASDPNEPDYYHRQLSHRWTDLDSPRYLPASDTVVTWSSLFRQTVRENTDCCGEVGMDLVLYADGHVAVVPGPGAAVTADATQARAIVRPPKLGEE